MNPGPNVPDPLPDAVSERWDDLRADAEATADEYRDADWEVLLLRPGDVTPLLDDPVGLDVLLPGDEYEALEDLIADVTVDSSSVYRATDGGVHFYALVYEASDADVAVVCPAFLPVDDAGALEGRVEERGELVVRLRPLSTEAGVTLTHEDTSPFF